MRTAQYAWIKAQIGVGIDVNASPINRSRTRLVTAAAPSHTIGRFHAFGFWTDEFEAHGAVFPAADTVKFQLHLIAGAKRNAVLIQMRLVLAGGIAAVHRNNSSLKLKLPQQGAVSIIAVKGGVAQECFVMQTRMAEFEIPEDWKQRP